jgi:hypothetical protein
MYFPQENRRNELKKENKLKMEQANVMMLELYTDKRTEQPRHCAYQLPTWARRLDI